MDKGTQIENVNNKNSNKNVSIVEIGNILLIIY